MILSKRQLRRIIREEKNALLREQPEILGALPGPPDPRLAQAIDMLEDIMSDLMMQGAQRDPNKQRDPYRHKKAGTYGGSEAVRRAEEAELKSQWTYDELKPLMELLLGIQEDA